MKNRDKTEVQTNFRYRLSNDFPDDESVRPFEGLVAKEDINSVDNNTFPTYFKIEFDDRKPLVLKAKLSKYNKQVIYINSSLMKVVDESKDYTITQISEKAFLCYRIFISKDLKMVRWGLFLSITGFWIDGSFAIGKTKSLILIDMSDRSIFVLMVCGICIKIVGAVLLFWKAIKE